MSNKIVNERLKVQKMEKGDDAGTLPHVRITECPLRDYKRPLMLNSLGQNVKQLLWSSPDFQCRRKR